MKKLSAFRPSQTKESLFINNIFRRIELGSSSGDPGKSWIPRMILLMNTVILKQTPKIKHKNQF